MAVLVTEAKGDQGMKRDRLSVALPDIRVRPKELLAVAKVLAACDEKARSRRTVFLMEQWDRSGHVVGTTPQSITLDALGGRARCRIAVLLPGSLPDPVSDLPLIALM